LINLSEIEKLKENIKELKGKSEIVKQIDDKIAETELTTKRHVCIQKLEEVIKKLNIRADKKALQNLTSINNMLVSSSYMAISRGGRMVEDFFPSIHYDRTSLGFFSAKNSYDLIDNRRIRAIYIDEYNQRCSILIRKIREGQLDEVLGFSTYKILHMINGRYGELLPRLGIDPIEGMTYNLLKNI